MGRHEYSPSLYLNSWRLFQQFLPALEIRIHGVLDANRSKGRELGLARSIVTSTQDIEGGHPSARQIGVYMKACCRPNTPTGVKRRITSTESRARSFGMHIPAIG